MFDSVKSFFTTKKEGLVPGEETEMDSDFLSEFDLDGSKALKDKSEDENVADVTRLLVALDQLFDKQEKILREKISAQNNESLSEEEREARTTEIDRRYAEVQSEARLLEEKIRPYESVLGKKFPDDRAIFALSNHLKVGYTEKTEGDNQYQEPMSMENPGFSLSPLPKEKPPLPVSEKPFNWETPDTVSLDGVGNVEFVPVSAEEKQKFDEALRQGVKRNEELGIDGRILPDHGNTPVETLGAEWRLAGEAPMHEAPMFKIEFDLDDLKEILAIRKKGYEYAKRKADDPENAPLKSEFQKEAKSSMEEYRVSLNEARLKLAEMIKSSDGDAKKLLMQEFADVVRELGSLDQGDVPEELPQEKAA